MGEVFGEVPGCVKTAAVRAEWALPKLKLNNFLFSIEQEIHPQYKIKILYLKTI